MNQLDGKRYWLIGASTGIGRELAKSLSRAGAVLAISARDENALGELLKELEPVAGGAGTHMAMGCDVTEHSDVDRAYTEIGPVDGLIYCAGVYEPMSARQPDLESLETMIDVNVTGALRVLAACVPDFWRRGTGHILLLGSISGYRGLPDAWGYGASKAALIHLGENLRCDLRRTEIRVQVCNPGFVATRLTDKNHFPMPFIMSTAEAAGRIVRGMQRSQFEIAFPFVMQGFLKCLAFLPRSLYFLLISRVSSQLEPPQ